MDKCKKLHGIALFINFCVDKMGEKPMELQVFARWI